MYLLRVCAHHFATSRVITEPADCILYYSPRDVPRMIKMTHSGSAGAEVAFWQMVRYSQEPGNDEICRSFLLTALGEPGTHTRLEDLRERQMADGIYNGERRDVGLHAKTVTQLLDLKLRENENVTMNMLVKEWRAKPTNAVPW